MGVNIDAGREFTAKAGGEASVARGRRGDGGRGWAKWSSTRSPTPRSTAVTVVVNGMAGLLLNSLGGPPLANGMPVL